VGLFTDLVLASLGRQLFPWLKTSRRGWFSQALSFARGRGQPPAPGSDVPPAAKEAARA